MAVGGRINNYFVKTNNSRLKIKMNKIQFIVNNLIKLIVLKIEVVLGKKHIVPILQDAQLMYKTLIINVCQFQLDVFLTVTNVLKLIFVIPI